ncbi:DUF4286 family protein [Aquabacter spiritensis]|uniref:EthD domain-containing protein n=1 Tax=Aquabacter spiritensis TaxID=933073 RepID=A0A4R3M4V2_9HYPH|nr:DUF4286 family protein [Aquabacter spiritensis]TCT06225.1 hypothetical protein EDC64_103329 [Aquabacter spiritensis]
MGALGLGLAVYDTAPPAAAPVPGITRQVWKGGRTNRETRGLIADPPFWITLDEAAADAVPAPRGTPVLSWDLVQLVPGDRPSPEEAGGLILTSMDVEPAVEEEFNAWYTTEHIPLLSQVPGMIAARRFAARATTGGAPRYMALYHVTDAAIYALDAWTRANFTPWMLRMRQFQTNRTYFMFTQREN